MENINKQLATLKFNNKEITKHMLNYFSKSPQRIQDSTLCKGHQNDSQTPQMKLSKQIQRGFKYEIGNDDTSIHIDLSNLKKSSDN